MMKKYLISALVWMICIGGVSSLFAQTGPRTDAEKIKARVVKLGMGKDVTVIMKNRDEYHGSIDSIAADSFTLAEADLRQAVAFKYSEVKKVQSGYGHSRDWTGRRIPPRLHMIGLIAGAAAILIPVILIASARD